MTDRGRALRRIAIGAVAVLALAGAGWGISDRLERNDDFCISCHVAPGRPLHAAIRRDFDARPAATLAAAHRAAGGRDGGAFHCIDCHGGVGLHGRARVKALAAKDAFFYVIGDFEEPTGMRWPLWDEDCRQCHAAFDEGAAEAWASPRFHQLSVHNAALGVDCVACHRAHPDGDPAGHYLRAREVRRECARCHSEYEEGLE
jgi:nitrate/TMAO reductase-like tetraheme cytochrome c subunit